VPCLCKLYPGICLKTEEKYGKSSVRVEKTSVKVGKTSVRVEETKLWPINLRVGKNLI
jgi:hypothetical protein